MTVYRTMKIAKFVEYYNYFIEKAAITEKRLINRLDSLPILEGEEYLQYIRSLRADLERNVGQHVVTLEHKQNVENKKILLIVLSRIDDGISALLSRVTNTYDCASRLEIITGTDTLYDYTFLEAATHMSMALTDLTNKDIQSVLGNPVSKDLVSY